MKSNELLAGALAGFTATVPMTAVMLSLHRALPARQRYPLPPRRITVRAARKAHVAHELDEHERTAATWLAHFGYGTATGAAYAALVAPRVGGHPVLKGTGFGLAVWALSYLGLMPALGLHPPATREPAGRNGWMILAHVAWGSVLGALTEPLNRRVARAGRAGRLRSARAR